MPVTVSERAFAKLVGAAHSTVTDRRKAGRLPRSARKDARGRWRIDREIGLEEWEELAPLRVKPGATDAETLRAWREARARRETALAAKEEDELRRRRGELVEARAMEDHLAGVFTRCKQKILGVPTRLRQRVPDMPPKDLVLLEELLREALDELAEPKEERAHG